MGEYYNEVGSYYDEDVELGFESRAESNRSLNRIREEFRSYVKRLKFKNALEIGCGPGLDALWFGKSFPNATLLAIDVSQKMVEAANRRTEAHPNVQVRQATENDLTSLPNSPYDMVFVFFGALNTMKNLKHAADQIEESLEPGGHAVLTFVNKWYLREIIVNLLKLRFKTAFSRLGKIWGGYSPSRYLASKCYTPKQVRNAFSAFEECDHQGYSIVFPAWYNDHKVKQNPARAERLWNLDSKLNRTPFWSLGEYTLFVFQKPKTI